jgi:hypothetical protein
MYSIIFLSGMLFILSSKWLFLLYCGVKIDRCEMVGMESVVIFDSMYSCCLFCSKYKISFCTIVLEKLNRLMQ